MCSTMKIQLEEKPILCGYRTWRTTNSVVLLAKLGGATVQCCVCVSVSGVHRERQWEPVTKRVTFGSQGGGLGDYASTHKKHTILKRGPPQIYLPLLQKTVSIIRLPVSPLDKAL